MGRAGVPGAASLWYNGGVPARQAAQEKEEK